MLHFNFVRWSKRFTQYQSSFTGSKYSHEIFEEKLNLCRMILGKDSISALMTTTYYSLGRFKEIVNEYIQLGFNSIFLRTLNPYGFAKRDKHKIAYPISEFIDNYKEAGNVYVSDEARMMSSTNNYYFKMGNVKENTYQEMFNGVFLHNIITNSCTECLPVCSECAYQPFCGAESCP